MKRVAVIGAGVFGLSSALELANIAEVDVYEKSHGLLLGASLGNQNRFHFGYHYPRSQATARECREALEGFQKEFGPALLEIENYYAVARVGSKTTGDAYRAFCDAVSLPHPVGWPPEELLRRTDVEACFRVPEPIFDIQRLRTLFVDRLARAERIRLHFEHEVNGGRLLPSGRKQLAVRADGGEFREDYDWVVDCSYTGMNRMCDWFGFDRRPLQFELVEIPVVQIPRFRDIGVTIMDGPFCSLLPNGSSGTSLLYHVEASVLERRVAFTYEPPTCFDSNSNGILEASARRIPILSEAKLIRSVIAVRCVDPSAEHDDARRTEVIDHGSGCWSIFSGKIGTACSAAQEMRMRLSDPSAVQASSSEQSPLRPPS